MANRAYYAIYYCMSAVLHLDQVTTRTHQGARSKFSELFIKTQKFPAAFADMLQKTFDYRQKADYDFTTAISCEEAEMLVRNAAAFIKSTQEYFHEQD